MENNTFLTRKNFLEKYFKKRILFTVADEENDGVNSSIIYISNLLKCKWYGKEFIKKLKEFTYYHMSKSLNENKKLGIINIKVFMPEEDIPNQTFNETMILHEQIQVLKMEDLTEETFLGLFDFLFKQYVDELEFLLHPTKDFKFLIKSKTCKKNIINLPKCYKSETCIICLDNSPNVLFCNCGHLCYCIECSKIKNFTECPVCKTLNEIVRIIE